MSFNSNTSEVLAKEVQGSQPRSYELTDRITALLEQYGASAESLAHTRIPNILEQTEALALETGDRIAVLHAETIVQTRLGTYDAQVAALAERQKGTVADILAANDEKYTLAA